MKAILLDINGVLNSYCTTERSPAGCVGISDYLCSKLRQLIEIVEEKTSEAPQVILTSSWKEIDPEDEDYKYRLSESYGHSNEKQHL